MTWLGGAAGDQRGDVAALEATVDVHHDNVGRAAVEHRQQGSEAAEGGAVADAGRHGNDRAIDQPADDAGQGAVHAGDDNDAVGVSVQVTAAQQAVDSGNADVRQQI